MLYWLYFLYLIDMKDWIIKVISEYGNRIWVIWLIITILVMILAIKTYVNYNVIEEEIDKVNSNIESINQEIAYSEKFYKNYLDSDYANYFLAHKNNSIFYWEMIIRLVDTSISDLESQESQSTPTTWNVVDFTSPMEARKYFISSKINK